MRVKEATMKPKCDVCADKLYIIRTRDDGRMAVQRCDACRGPDSEMFLCDEGAAFLAKLDGIKCSGAYPCVLL
jgi:hypothetical protein